MIFESGGRGREPFYVDDIFRLGTNLDALSGEFFCKREFKNILLHFLRRGVGFNGRHVSWFSHRKKKTKTNLERGR